MSTADEIRKEYRTNEIAVIWEPRYCIHSARCIAGNVAVFDPRERPWVHADRAPADETARIIATCPTGALHYQRLDGAPQEPVPTTTTVDVQPNGPLFLRGDIEVKDANGAVIRRDTRVALCRCGHSRQKPFCDNSHRMVNFADPGVEAT